MLGLGAVAAPVAVKAVQAETEPVSAMAIRYRHRDEQRILDLQRDIDRLRSRLVSSGSHTHTLAGADPSHSHTFSGDYVFMSGDQWTPEQIARMSRQS